jgi:hypothetical protein
MDSKDLLGGTEQAMIEYLKSLGIPDPNKYFMELFFQEVEHEEEKILISRLPTPQLIATISDPKKLHQVIDENFREKRGESLAPI